MIDIIQAVGRVIRKAEDKRIGTVVMPDFVDESVVADHVLSHSAFEPVWQVLKALRAHDQKLADELDQLRLKLCERSRGGGKVRLSDEAAKQRNLTPHVLSAPLICPIRRGRFVR